VSNCEKRPKDINEERVFMELHCFSDVKSTAFEEGFFI